MTLPLSDIVATLEPIHQDDEILKGGLTRRPALSLSRNDTAPLILGRNATTGISDSHVSETSATIQWKDNNQVWLERHSRHLSVIQPDGSVVTHGGALDHGTIVRLYKQDYAYRVQLHTSTEQKKNTTTTDSFKETAEECMCAVCMEIVVNSTAVVPCGHVYCQECLQAISQCPNCRIPIQRKVHVKTMDNIIVKLIQSGQVFAQADVQHYWTRVTPPDPHPVVVQSPPKRARRANAVVSVDLTVPRAGDTADDAICVD